MKKLVSRFKSLLATESRSTVIQGHTEELDEFGLKGWVSDIENISLYAVFSDGDTELHPIFFSRADIKTRNGVGFKVALPPKANFETFKVQARILHSNLTQNLSNAYTKSEIHARLVPSKWVSAGSIGKIISSDASEISTAGHWDASEGIDVLFVDGMNGGPSTMYRVQHILDGLKSLGIRTASVTGAELDELSLMRINFKIVIFFRTPYLHPFSSFAELMRARGSIIGFDVDDFVFDETLVPKIDGARFLSEQELVQYRKGISAYKKFITVSNFVTVSTNYLVDRVNELGRPAFRVRNTLSPLSIDTYRTIAAPSPGKNKFVIGYYSGTKTHQADFRVAVDGLKALMSRHDRVNLRVVGLLDLSEFPQLNEFSHRIISVGLMPHQEMLADQEHCDLIIAPLEADNPFCEAKSELKFFEAALLKRPFLGSDTAVMREATDNGRYGVLASSPGGWAPALFDIVERYQFHVGVAERAQKFVIEHYSQEFGAKEAENAYSKIRTADEESSSASGAYLPNPSFGRVDIGFVIPDVVIGGGGHRKIFSICHYLESIGQTVALYVLSARPTSVILGEIRTYFYDINPQVFNFQGSICTHRHVVCTSWATAYVMRTLEHQSLKSYFVQDFEPAFFPASSDSMRALATYSMPMNIICYGAWVAAKLQAEVGATSTLIPFTLDHDKYKPADHPEDRQIDVLLFARPSQSRRCFELVVEGLGLLIAKYPDLKIGLFGEMDYPDIGMEFTNFGLITEGVQLASLYQKAKIGICFSTSNPSMLGYEMVACGCNLLDVRIKHHELNFGGDQFVKYCSGTPESVLTACEDLLADPEDQARRRRLGYEFVSTMPPDLALGKMFYQALEKLQRD